VTKFCKEVHHEKQRQRAKPFWQWFRNKEAREMHESQVNELRRTWIHDNDVEVNKLRQDMERIWTPIRQGRMKKIHKVDATFFLVLTIASIH